MTHLTTEQLDELERRLNDSKRVYESVPIERWGMSLESHVIKSLIHAAREVDKIKEDNISNRLDEALIEIERLATALGEAQQWIDSEPDWKDKYNANYKKLSDANDLLICKLQTAIEGLKLYATGQCGRFVAQQTLKTIEEMK